MKIDCFTVLFHPTAAAGAFFRLIEYRYRSLACQNSLSSTRTAPCFSGINTLFSFHLRAAAGAFFRLNMFKNKENYRFTVFFHLVAATEYVKK